MWPWSFSQEICRINYLISTSEQGRKFGRLIITRGKLWLTPLTEPQRLTCTAFLFYRLSFAQKCISDRMSYAVPEQKRWLTSPQTMQSLKTFHYLPNVTCCWLNVCFFKDTLFLSYLCVEVMQTHYSSLVLINKSLFLRAKVEPDQKRHNKNTYLVTRPAALQSWHSWHLLL